MKHITKLIIITILCLAVTGCNPVARKMGGNMTIHLKPQEKLVNTTWKDSSLWILTRQMKENETPETYKFREDSTFGVLEGTVTIIKTK